MKQSYRPPVILCYCWSNIWNPRFKACLWIPEDSCQNWQLKYQNFIRWASARSRCQDWRQHSRSQIGTLQPRSSFGDVGISQITSHWGCRCLQSERGLTGSRSGFLHCFEKSRASPTSHHQRNRWGKSLPQIICCTGGELKKASSVHGSQDVRKPRASPRVKATLHFVGTSNVLWEVRRSLSELQMNCCGSWAVTSADAQGYGSVKIDSRSLGKILVTRQIQLLSSAIRSRMK